MTTASMLSRLAVAQEQIRSAEKQLAAGNLGLAHLDLSRAHVTLHEVDDLIVNLAIRLPAIPTARPEALR